MIAKNDEEKRSKIWQYVTTGATVVILVVAAYFLFTLFAGNPLAGRWWNEERNLELSIHKGGAVTAFWPEVGEAANVKLNLNSSMEKRGKTISFQIDPEEVAKTVEASDGALTEEAVISEAGVLENTFDYNLSNGKLTLSEREYGEQMVFVKK